MIAGGSVPARHRGEIRTKLGEMARGRLGCSLCEAAGRCICYDDEAIWLEFALRSPAKSGSGGRDAKG